MSDSTTPQDPEAMSPASTGSLAWIPVTERLPRPGQQVLAAIPPRVWNEENQAIIETLDYEQKGFYSWKDDEWPKGVTHWMPLPAPPTDAK